MLPRTGHRTPWPAAKDLFCFIERHRYREAGRGLFVIDDDMGRSIGMALIGAGAPQSRYLSEEDATRHRAAIEAALQSVAAR